MEFHWIVVFLIAETFISGANPPYSTMLDDLRAKKMIVLWVNNGTPLTWPICKSLCGFWPCFSLETENRRFCMFLPFLGMGWGEVGCTSSGCYGTDVLTCTCTRTWCYEYATQTSPFTLAHLLDATLQTSDFFLKTLGIAKERNTKIIKKTFGVWAFHFRRTSWVLKMWWNARSKIGLFGCFHWVPQWLDTNTYWARK